MYKLFEFIQGNYNNNVIKQYKRIIKNIKIMIFT